MKGEMTDQEASDLGMYLLCCLGIHPMQWSFPILRPTEKEKVEAVAEIHYLEPINKELKEFTEIWITKNLTSEL